MVDAESEDSGTGGSGTRDRLTDVVELVNHETRAAILVALADRHREAPRHPALRFSELRERVGHDDPGNFNYHLQRLTGELVERTDDGYELSEVGHRFVGTLLSGKYDPDVELAVPDVEFECLVCGGVAAVAYADGTFRVECEGDHSLRVDVSPSVVTDRSVETAVNVALAKGQFETRLTIEGFCPLCGGRTSGGLETSDFEHADALYAAVCERCGVWVQNTAGGCVLDHPAVVSLCYDHGLDVREDAHEVLTDHVGPAEVREEDPLRVEVVVSVGDDAVVLELDETAEVVDVTEDVET